MNLFIHKHKEIDVIVKIALGLLVGGLYFSNALKSISLVTLAIAAIFHSNTYHTFKSLLKNKLFISVLLISALFILSILYGGNNEVYFKSIKYKILYLFIPIAINNTSFTKKDFSILTYLFIICAIIQSIYSTYFFWMDQSLSLNYSQGQVLPTIKIHHVEIAWLISISILLLFNELRKNYSIVQNGIAIILIIWLMVFVHIFAVRTGILTLYLFIGLQMLRILFFNKGWSSKIVLILMLSLLVIPYKYFDNLKNKIGYTFYDIKKFMNSDADLQYYSDARRIQSVVVGIKIIQEHPITGCGIGNIGVETEKIYHREFPHIHSENHYKPHSFYIYILSSFGIPLGIFVLLCFSYPWMYFIREKNFLFFCIYSSILLISVWDVIMLTQFGECIYLLLVSFGIYEKCSTHQYKQNLEGRGTANPILT